MPLNKSNNIISIAVFKDKNSSKHWIEIGKDGGLDKVSDSEKQLVQLVCCTVQQAKLEIASLKRKYNI